MYNQVFPYISWIYLQILFIYNNFLFLFQKHLGQAESRTNTLRLLITILKPKGIDYQVELEKRDYDYVPNYTIYYGTYEPQDRLTVELSANGDTFYQSWLQLTYDRQYTSEILKLVEYLHTPLKFVGLN